MNVHLLPIWILSVEIKLIGLRFRPERRGALACFLLTHRLALLIGFVCTHGVAKVPVQDRRISLVLALDRLECRSDQSDVWFFVVHECSPPFPFGLSRLRSSLFYASFAERMRLFICLIGESKNFLKSRFDYVSGKFCSFDFRLCVVHGFLSIVSLCFSLNRDVLAESVKGSSCGLCIRRCNVGGTPDLV